MRIDHHAYQRATGVSIAGLLAQLAISLLLLFFGNGTGDTTAVFAATWAFTGLVVWLGLVLVFHQHRLERLESLEMDGGARLDDEGRLFATDEARVARKRLDLMHAALMPALSILYAVLLVGLAWSLLWWLDVEGDPNADYGAFGSTTAAGWQLAVAFGTALVSFIFSRFLAGMAVQPAWSNLRGGAGIMVGNALVALALGVGTVFEMLKEGDAAAAVPSPVLRGVCYGIAIFMIVVAGETALNFVLNLYRPRRAGETPRPAFDSRLLSLLAAPDSIVRSINEAVNYQFGFDITSSWGYQLLLRSFARLSALGVVVLLLLTTLVVVEPQEQGRRLRFGAPVGEVLQGGAMLKLPWPVDTAVVERVNLVRELPLGVVRPVRPDQVLIWGEESIETSRDNNLFLVAAGVSPDDAGAAADETGVAGAFALVEADVILQYRVRDLALWSFLEFSGDAKSRRDQLDMRERALKAIALREVTRAMSVRSLAEVLSPPADAPLVDALAQAIQSAFDVAETGVEVVGVSIPRLRPPGTEGGKFEELSIARQNARRQVEDAQSTVNTTMSFILGDVAKAEEMAAGLAEFARLEAEAKAGDARARADADALRLRLEQMVLDSRAQAATVIANARAMRWSNLMDTQSIAQEVLGEAAAWRVNPDLYRTRRTMDAIAQGLAQVRVKYMLLPDADRVRLDVEMREPTSGLNLTDYLEKKTDGE
ncbi:MAG: hypothetical protein RIS86_331 [Planctomycetota bacterium]|jgi:regulator of protease activity HflC (stomatin/prohibitin superfamily)